MSKINQFLFEERSGTCDFPFEELDKYSFSDIEKIMVSMEEKLKSEKREDQFFFHKVLNHILNAHFEHDPSPAIDRSWQACYIENKMLELWLEPEIRKAKSQYPLPNENQNFREWFNEFVESHPASRHPLLKFLEEDANINQIAYYIFQENPSDANFEDLIISLQIGIDNLESKMELSRNYWDEMGNGNIKMVHTELYNNFLTEIRRLVPEFDAKFEPLWEAIATGNHLLYSCKYRSTRYLGIGCLGVIEKLFSEMSINLLKSYDRVGFKEKIYHKVHSIIDTDHSDGWVHHVFDEMEGHGQGAKEEMALGAILRLNIINAMYDHIYNQFKSGLIQ